MSETEALAAREYPELSYESKTDDRGIEDQEVPGLVKHPQDMPDPQAVDDEPEGDWVPALAAKRGDWVTLVFARDDVLPQWQQGRTWFAARLVQYPQGAGDCFRVETVDGVVLDINGNSSEFVVMVSAAATDEEETT